jgi:hypothetical protein
MSVAARIDPDRLRNFATAAYVATGMWDLDARLCADTLVQADFGAINLTAQCELPSSPVQILTHRIIVALL